MYALLAVVAVAALALSACSSSSTKSSSSSTAAAGASSGGSSAPKGAPINVMTIASVNYNGPNYANILTTAKLYEKYINAHGGIAGRPLDVTTCDEQGDPNKIANCGRQAISDHDVAVIGSFTLNGEAIIPELVANNISWFGICCAASATELTSPDVQQIGSGGSYAGLAVKAVEDGCKKIDLVELDSGATAQFEVTLTKNALKSVNGPPLNATVLIPITAQDYSAQVAQATEGTDCLLAVLAEANFAPFLTAFISNGGKQRIYGPQGNLDQKIVSQFPASATNNDVIVGSYSDISLPVWADYRSAIKDYNAPSDEDYNSLGGLGTWAAYVAFKQVAESVTGDLTASSFLAAAQKADVNLTGRVADANFTQKFTGLGGTFLNDVNRTGTFDIIKNGKLVPFQNGKFYDFTNAMLGTPLPSSDLPPGGQ